MSAIAAQAPARRAPALRPSWRAARTLWRCRWALARLALASFLLWVLAADTGARLARLTLARLPDFDYVAEIAHLRQAGRFGEAIVVADAGLDAATGQTQIEVLRQKQQVIAERDSTLRKIKDVGLGALSGRGDSLEMLVGAVATDLVIVGDIRDLLIQAAKYVMDGETDEVIVLLSSLGIVTTLAPEIDWAPSILKAARKAGRLTEPMAEFLKTAIKGRKLKQIEAVVGDVATLAERASPGGAARLLAYADTPRDISRLARFVERNGKGAAGAFTLHVTGKDGADLLKAAEGAGQGAAAAQDAVQAERVLVAAARKGEPGVAWLRAGHARSLLRPHPILGLTKGLWKGNVQRLITQAIERADVHAWWVVPLLAAWVFVECGLLLRRLTARPA